MTNLRIRRLDKKNLVIEERNGKTWQVQGYFGSAWGLCNALVNQIDELSDEGKGLAWQLDCILQLIDARTEAIARQLEAILQADEDAVIELEIGQ